MSCMPPPALAYWTLTHLVPGESNDALAGDLHEEFCSGRSAAWYWGQVLSAIAIGCLRELRIRRAALLFAGLWSMLAPAWMLWIADIERHANFKEYLAQMTWPWSIVCDLGLTLAGSLLFLWAGILLYLLPGLWINGASRLRTFGRGLAASVPSLLVLWLALIVFSMHFVAVHTVTQAAALRAPTPFEAYRIDMRKRVAAYGSHKVVQDNKAEDKTPGEPEFGTRDAIADMRVSAMLMRLPFFLVVLCTLWSLSTKTERYVS